MWKNKNCSCPAATGPRKGTTVLGNIRTKPRRGGTVIGNLQNLVMERNQSAIDTSDDISAEKKYHGNPLGSGELAR